MPVKVAIRTRDKVAQTQVKLLGWFKNLNPGLHMENWKVLVRQSEPKGQRLILHIDQHSLAANQKTGFKIFTGLSQGTVKVLRDIEMRREGTAPNIASSESVYEGEGDRTPTSSDDQRGAAGAREEIPPRTKPTSANQGTFLKEPGLTRRKQQKRRGWRQTQNKTHTQTIKFLEINLHHCKAAKATLCQQPAEGKADIALIQELRTYRGQGNNLFCCTQKQCKFLYLCEESH
jgi:hypothetical protein